MDERQKRILHALTETGDTEAIALYVDLVKQLSSASNKPSGAVEPVFSKTRDALYKHYIDTRAPTCKTCNTPIGHTYVLTTRNMDCGATDPEVGCCCCGTGPAFHKPENAQFFCNSKCKAQFMILANKVLDECIRTMHGPAALHETYEKQLRLLQTTRYEDSKELFAINQTVE